MRIFRLTLNLLCAALVLTASASGTRAADEIQWSTNIEASLRKAAAEGKPVLMEFTASWCVYCKRMEKTTFVDPRVVKSVSQNFVAVRIDADQNKALVTDLAIKGLPAILIVSPDLQILERISGFQTPEALTPKLDRFAVGPSHAAPPQVAAANRTPRPSPAQSVARPKPPGGDFQFEAITHEEAVPANRRNSVQPVSKPRAVTGAPASTQDVVDDETTRFFAEMQAANSQPQFEEPVVRKPAATPAKSTASFGGQCLVSAVEDRELIQGSPRVQLEYRGQLLHFRSEDHKQQFLAEPGRYWPMLDGACAMTMLDDEKKAPGELQFAAVFRKRVWLFCSEQKMKEFLMDPADVVEGVADMQSEQQR